MLYIQKRSTNKLESMSLSGFFRFSQKKKKAKKIVVTFIFFIHCSKCLNIDWQVCNSLLENPAKAGSFVFEHSIWLLAGLSRLLAGPSW